MISLLLPAPIILWTLSCIPTPFVLRSCSARIIRGLIRGRFAAPWPSSRWFRFPCLGRRRTRPGRCTATAAWPHLVTFEGLDFLFGKTPLFLLRLASGTCLWSSPCFAFFTYENHEGHVCSSGEVRFPVRIELELVCFDQFLSGYCHFWPIPWGRNETKVCFWIPTWFLFDGRISLRDRGFFILGTIKGQSYDLFFRVFFRQVTF